jgi:DNA-binding transcriptional LysR family regulator
VAFASNSPQALLAAAKASKGVVALTELWGSREPGLQRLFAVPGLPPRALWLVTTAAAAKRPAIVVVTQRIVQLFGRAAPFARAPEALS